MTTPEMQTGEGTTGTGSAGLLARARAVVTSPWFRRDILLPYGITRLWLIVVGLLAAPRFTPSPPIHGVRVNMIGVPALDLFDYGDTYWYMSIVRGWYEYQPGAQSNTAFYPAYPVLLRLLTAPWGAPPSEAAVLLTSLLVSQAAFLTATALLYRLVREDLGDAVARRAVLYLLVFPTTMYFVGMYTESWFLMILLAGIAYARAGRWVPAGLFGALVVLSRPVGVLVLIPLLWTYFSRRWAERRTLLPGPGVLALGLPGVAAFVGWAAYLWRISGDPTLISHTSDGWGRKPTPIPETVRSIFHHLRQRTDLLRQDHNWIVLNDPSEWMDLFFFFTFLGLLAAAWWVLRRRRGETAFAVIAMLLPCTTGLLASFSRYILVCYPAFVVLAALGARSRAFHWSWVALCAALGTLMMARYVLHYWVA